MVLSHQNEQICITLMQYLLMEENQSLGKGGGLWQDIHTGHRKNG
jgi:hypothetical protein